MYISALVIPVPEENRESYRRWALRSAEIFKSYGCIEIVESWEDNVPVGKQTDFRRAVAAKEGEKIVFSWLIWPDKESFYASEARMHEDKALETSDEIPFDASRLIYGCFQPLHVLGRDAATSAA